MGRVTRYVRRFFAVLSLLIAIVLAVLWARSPNYDEAASWGTLDGRCYSLRSEPHRIQFEIMSGLPPQVRPYLAKLRVGSHSRVLRLTTGELAFRYDPPPHDFLGFGWESRPSPGTPGMWFKRVTVPYALPIAAFASPALLMLGRSIRRCRRIRAGCCVACGYDLRASAARCPECGVEAMPAVVPLLKGGI